MITKELVEYVKAELAKGIPYDILRMQILKTGWALEDFNEAMREIHPGAAEPAVQKQAPVIPVATPVIPATPITPTAPVTPAAPMIPRADVITPHIAPVVEKVAQPIVTPIAQPAQPIQPIQPVQPIVAIAPEIKPEIKIEPEIKQPAVSIEHGPVSYIPPASITPVTPVAVAYPAIVQTSSSKKKIIFAIVGIVVILLIALGIYGYAYGYFTPLSVVTSQALEASRNAKTSSFDITIGVDISGLKDQPDSLAIPGFSTKTFSATIKGVSDATDPKHVNFESTTSFDAGQINAGLEVRAVSDTIYAQLTKAPNLGFFSLAPYENKWVSFPESDFNKADTNPLGSVTPISTTVIDSLSQQQKDHIADMTAKAHFITITKRLSPEKINGVLSYHFTFDIDRAGTRQYLKDLTEYIHSIGTNDSALSAFDATSYGDSLDQIKTFNGEAWIGIHDHLPYKFSTTMNIAEKGNAEAGVIKVTVVGLFNDWNKPVTIVAPSDSVPFETFISGVMGGGMQAAPTTPAVSQIDAQKEATLANMRVTAELFYNSNHSSYTGVCTTNAGTTQGLLSQAKTLPANTAYKCRSTSSAWAASVNLSTNDYYCVDNTGFTGHIPKAQTATSCSR